MSSALDTAHSVLSSVLKLFMQQGENAVGGGGRGKDAGRTRESELVGNLCSSPLDTVRHLAALQNYAKQFDFETKMAENAVKAARAAMAALAAAFAISVQIMRRLWVQVLQLQLPHLCLLFFCLL